MGKSRQRSRLPRAFEFCEQNRHTKVHHKACSIGDGLRVMYVIAARPIMVRGLRPDTEYRLTVFDPVTGKRAPQKTVITNAKGEWHGLPPAHGHDWVVPLTR